MPSRVCLWRACLRMLHYKEAARTARAPPCIYTVVESEMRPVVYLGVARPQGASVGNKLSRGHSTKQAHPGYYCLIDGQTNGSRPPYNNAVIKLSADKSARDRSPRARPGSHRLRIAARRLSYIRTFSLRRPSSFSLSLSISVSPLITGIKAMSRLHGRPAILYALMSAHVVVSGRALGPRWTTRMSHSVCLRPIKPAMLARCYAR